MLQLYRIVIPNVMQQGFSAFKTGVSANSNYTFVNWNTDSPYYGSPDFSTSSGLYTVPDTGNYSIEATINYSAGTLNAQTGDDQNPYFSVESGSTIILKGFLPILDVSIFTLISLRALLGTGQVTLAGEASLTKGSTLGLNYRPGGLTITINFNSVVWSVYRIT